MGRPTDGGGGGGDPAEYLAGGGVDGGVAVAGKLGGVEGVPGRRGGLEARIASVEAGLVDGEDLFGVVGSHGADADAVGGGGFGRLDDR